jgi:hypothetical protein
LGGCARPRSRRLIHAAAHLVVYPAALFADDPPATGGIRGTILSIKDDSIVIRVPPDNLKLEVAKSAIASVTQPEDATNS